VPSGARASSLRRKTLECRATFAIPERREGGPREVAAFGDLADWPTWSSFRGAPPTSTDEVVERGSPVVSAAGNPDHPSMVDLGETLATVVVEGVAVDTAPATGLRTWRVGGAGGHRKQPS
jgi:hypothetical protein